MNSHRLQCAQLYAKVVAYQLFADVRELCLRLQGKVQAIHCGYCVHDEAESLGNGFMELAVADLGLRP